MMANIRDGYRRLPFCTWCGHPTAGFCELCTGKAIQAAVCSDCGGTDAYRKVECRDCWNQRCLEHGDYDAPWADIEGEPKLDVETAEILKQVQQYGRGYPQSDTIAMYQNWKTRMLKWKKKKKKWMKKCLNRHQLPGHGMEEIPDLRKAMQIPSKTDELHSAVAWMTLC